MRSRLILALLCASVAGAGTILPPTVESFGVQFTQIGLDGSYMYTVGDEVHWFGTWALPSGGGNTQLWDVNLSSGVGHYYDTNAAGRGNLAGRALTGTLFYTTTNDPCHIYRYNTAAGTFAPITKVGWEVNSCGTVAADKAVQVAFTAPDGIAVFGTATRGTIFTVDPADDAVTDYGVIDPPAGNATCTGCYRYVYIVAADATHIYALMRDANDATWWLVIVRRSDGAQTSCFRDQAFTSGELYPSADGTAIWYKGGGQWYRLDTTDGACPATPAAPPALKPWYKPSDVYFASNDGNAHTVALFDADIDDSAASADESTSGNATLRYRLPAGTGDYTTISRAFTTYPSPLSRLAAADGGAYLSSGSYGPVSTFDGASSTAHGRMVTQSTYAITTVGNVVYFSGYPNTTYKWSPGAAWTLTNSNNTACSAGTPSNPCVAFSGWGKHHLYSGAGSDGLLYVASSYQREDRAGGDIGWIASNGTTGSVEFPCDEPASFAPLSNGSTFAYSSSADGGYFGCSNTVGKLLIFDVSTKTVTHEWTPVAGSGSQGRVVGALDGDVLGLVTAFPTAGKYTLYKINPTTGVHAAWSPKEIVGVVFGASSSYNQRLTLGPDGQVWFWDSAHLKRVDPATGTVSVCAGGIPGIGYSEYVGSSLYFVTGGTTLKRFVPVNCSLQHR